MVQKCSRVKGFEFRVSSFEFRVSSFEFRVSSFEFRVSSFEFGNLVSGVEGEGFHLGSLPSISFFIKTVHCAAYICALDQLGFRPPESRETWVSGWVDEGLGESESCLGAVGGVRGLGFGSRSHVLKTLASSRWFWGLGFGFSITCIFLLV